MTVSAPNILLITSDQQRYDTLGVNGNGIIRTPNLDRLAAQGCNFRQAYVNNPVCVASRACLQTGRYTHQHGVEYMEDVVDNTPGLPPWEVTFMQRLQVAGYHTAAFGKMHMYPAKGFHESQLSGGQGARWNQPFGLPLGPSPMGNDYAVWLEARRPGAFAAIHEQRRSADYRDYGSAVTSVIDMEEYVDTWVAENCIDYLQRRREQAQPFFLWCGFLNPHAPLDAPRPYDTLYPADSVALPETFTADLSDRPAFYAERQQAFLKRTDSAKMRRMIGHYYGLCTMLDDLCGRIFTALRETDQWDNTLIIYTSDHGDMMGDYGMTGKSNFMQGSIHVPLVIKPVQNAETAHVDTATEGATTDATGLNTGRVCTGLVELIDLSATILDYAALPQADAMQGVSLRGLLEAPTDQQPAGKEQLLCEYTANDRSLKGKCLRTARYKYVIWSPGRAEELYDMQNDPLERRNLAADPTQQAVLADMRTRLLDHLTQSEKPLMNWL